MNRFFSIFFVACLVSIAGLAQPKTASVPLEAGMNQVFFSTPDPALQQLFDVAEKKAADNIKVFSPNWSVLVEGAEYPYVWVETQPMGGVMYAKRNLAVAYQNMVIFLQNQLESGRIPGMIIPMNNNMWNLTDLTKADDGRLGLFSQSLQGFFVPGPALELYYLLGRDRTYLDILYQSLEAYDAYLWRYRDSDGDGCLEAWCQTDSGEDNVVRLDHAPFLWPFDYPPTAANIPRDTVFLKNFWTPSQYRSFTPEKNPMPVESMDVMSYSYSCRDVLAKISAIRKDGRETHWRTKAQAVLRKMIGYLWLPEKNAYFYRDKANKLMPSLTHNTLRAMYFRAMTQPMADAFIRENLLNPDVFWTPMPLPSTAANDPFFRNISNNNWSGQPQGLTYQRAIGALENYGHRAEVTMIGARLLGKTSQTKRFTQQFDPFTTVQNGSDGYGPTILATLEYYTRLFGVYPQNDTLHFSGMAARQPYTYTQKLKDNQYKLVQDKGRLTGYLNGRELFSSTAGVDVMTSPAGKILGLAGIDTVARNVQFKTGGKSYQATIEPNGHYRLTASGIRLLRKVPFDFPYRKRKPLKASNL